MSPAVESLLLEAAQCRMRMHPPASEAEDEPFDAVRKLEEIAARLLALPDARAALERELSVPFDPLGTRASHALMAGLVLARSGGAESVRALLEAARGPDDWCATEAAINLGWLAREPETAAALDEAVDHAEPLQRWLVLDALVHQRAPERLDRVRRFVREPGDDAERSNVLTSLVCQLPSEGLALAAELHGVAAPRLAATALGLSAAYGDEEACRALAARAAARDEAWSAALRWLGRVPRPETIALLAGGLAHPDVETRLDVVTSLALVGERAALSAVVGALEDPAIEIATQASALLLDWLPDGEDAARRWRFDDDGRLAAASRRELAALAGSSFAALEPGARYLRGEPLRLTDLLDDLVVGLLPDHRFYHWVAATGAVAPYSTNKELLYNAPSLDALEAWLVEHHERFTPGAFLYQGRPLAPAT